MRREMQRALAFVGVLTGLSVLGAGAAQAQAVITGKVTSEAGQPLGGATLSFKEIPNGGVTASNGTYSLTIGAEKVKDQTVTMTARYLGYAPVVRVITLKTGSQEQNFQLRSDPLHLEDVVVTGVSEATSSKKLAFAVGRVSAEQLQETPGVTALGALAGKVAGVRVISGNGEPGSAPSIKLRSATSIQGSQDPLIIIDGTLSVATLADIASEDIERVEVVKGAAASSLYGSSGANGVIQIFTKRGASLADGKLLITARNEFGSSWLSARIPASQAHAFQIDASGNYIRSGGAPSGSRLADSSDVARNPYKVYHDHQAEAIKPGVFYTNYVSVGQRKGNTNFNASFQNTRTEGVVFNLKGYGRQNLRLNVDNQLTPKLDLSVSSFYGVSDNNQATQGPGAPFFGLTFLEPDTDIFAQCPGGKPGCSFKVGNPDGSPYRAFIPDRISNATNPLYELYNRKVNTDRNRFTGSGKLRWRIADWLTAEGNYNYDHEGWNYADLLPFGFLGATGTAGQGHLNEQSFAGRTYNTGATLTSIQNFWGSVTNTTKVSYIYEDQESHLLTTNASKLVVQGIPEYPAADGSTLATNSQKIAIRNRNVFAVTTFDIKDRYILDGLVRQDESSLFGPDARKAKYFRVSGAWRLNEDLHIKGIDEWRIRGSWGTAGLRPGFDYQYETLQAGGGSFTKLFLGNKNLKPAHSDEKEIGTNIEFGHGRFTLEYTYSKKTTKDQLLQVDQPAVSGFTSQWQNVGALEGSTHEVALGMQVLNTKDLAWTINITGDRTRQQITDWNIAKRLVSVQGQAQAFYLGPNVPLGVLYGNRIVRTIDELYDDPAKKAQSGSGQAWNRDSVIVNEEGYVVRKSAYHRRGVGVSNIERPLLYVDATGNNIVRIGDANPDFNASFSTNFTWKRFSATGLVDWSQGGNIYNGTRQWPFFDNRDIIYDQRGKPDAAQKSQTYYNTLYNGLNSIDFFVEPGTYVKIKELSVNYTFNKNELRKIGLGKLENVRLGVVGRNLFTFTKYSGYDPEVTGLAGDPFQFRFDGFSYPHFRTFTGTVEIAF